MPRNPNAGRGRIPKVQAIHDDIVQELQTAKSAPQICAELAKKHHRSPGTIRIYIWNVLGQNGCDSRVAFMASKISALQLSARGKGA